LKEKKARGAVAGTVAHGCSAAGKEGVIMIILQGAPIKNNPLEKMLYFSHDSMDLSQTFRLFM